MGLKNEPLTPGDKEYPVEFPYREVLSKDHLLEALSFFLVRVLGREEEGDKPERPAFTIFPRYRQSRLVRRVTDDISAHFAATGDTRRKYLADHSAGSGKTLSIRWGTRRFGTTGPRGTPGRRPIGSVNPNVKTWEPLAKPLRTARRPSLQC